MRRCAPSWERAPTRIRSNSTARRFGMTTMIEDAVAKCRAGLTSASEVLRVTTVR